MVVIQYARDKNSTLIVVETKVLIKDLMFQSFDLMQCKTRPIVRPLTRNTNVPSEFSFSFETTRTIQFPQSMLIRNFIIFRPCTVNVKLFVKKNWQQNALPTHRKQSV